MLKDSKLDRRNFFKELLKKGDIIKGKAEINTDRCLCYQKTFCQLCYNRCRNNAIKIIEGLYPKVDKSKCQGCGQCESNCVKKPSAIKVYTF
ncbi:4Fe-4S binding protein [Natranaerofaba carboxydovora]|uniref:4Fe-4S binding protein n=1 Tax=Natranaerofaba carboxydovora TaxID=2742683 RepID=UPI001F12AF09|nr:4Fe-4S binding protein [Natranaerofaba carboxydovora]UMZ73770.1 4Fe-4S binding domain protein [Natranaerofaba carboxydovora]